MLALGRGRGLGLWTPGFRAGLGWELVGPGDREAIGHTEDLSGTF